MRFLKCLFAGGFYVFLFSFQKAPVVGGSAGIKCQWGVVDQLLVKGGQRRVPFQEQLI